MWTFSILRCRPAVYEYHMVDIDADGNKKVLATHTAASDMQSWLEENFSKWIKRFGIKG